MSIPNTLARPGAGRAQLVKLEPLARVDLHGPRPLRELRPAVEHGGGVGREQSGAGPFDVDAPVGLDEDETVPTVGDPRQLQLRDGRAGEAMALIAVSSARPAMIQARAAICTGPLDSTSTDLLALGPRRPNGGRARAHTSLTSW